MSQNESQLIERAKKGDSSAFEQLITTYQNKVYNICLRMSGNTEDALDLAQDSLIRVYKALPLFKGESSFSTWLYSITSNVCIDFIRKQKKRKTLSLYTTDDEGEETLREIPDNRYQPEMEYEKSELIDGVRKGLDSLSPEHRQILVLREISGLSYQEISDVLDLECGTVKSRINRARKHLCDFLRNKGDGTPSNKGKGR